MNLAATIVDEQGRIQDETFKTLLCDKLFMEFDCLYWIPARGDDKAEFADSAS